MEIIFVVNMLLRREGIGEQRKLGMGSEEGLRVM